MTEAVGSERVGIVVPIPEPHAAELLAERAAVGDPHADVAPHVTLVTGVQVGDWNEVMEHVTAVAAATEPFRLVLGEADTFRPVTPVVYAAVTDGAQACIELHRALLRGPLTGPPAYPYVPHLTLAHGVDDATLDRVQAARREPWELHADRIAVYGDLGDDAWQLRALVPLGG